jgi:hypothetical protein
VLIPDEQLPTQTKILHGEKLKNVKHDAKKFVTSNMRASAWSG